MNVRVGYIPYLNMVPFHQGFGREAVEANGHRFEFHPMSPRVLGLEAKKGGIDAGALSLVDWLGSSSDFEPVGRYGIGVKQSAQSVFLFSKKAMPHFEGVCAVSDETSTSFRLLQMLLEIRYKRSGIHYGRIASSVLFDGDADGLLLIGDEALKAKAEGIKGLPVVTDLGNEWFQWHRVPFFFARWAMRSALPQDVKERLTYFIGESIKQLARDSEAIAAKEAPLRQLTTAEVLDYWNGFAYELSPDHERSIQLFSELLEKAYV